jgi:hypothetical protein
MTKKELMQRRALLHLQAAQLLRQDAKEHEAKAKKIEEDLKK